MTLADFARLLDVFGADRVRWPLAVRASAAQRLSSDPVAQRLLAEAEALDAVLLHSIEPTPSDIASLADRIVFAAVTVAQTAASQEPRMERPGARAVASSASPARLDWSYDFTRVAALLAASLMIGMFVGQSDVGARVVPALEDLTSLTSPLSAERVAMQDLHFEAVDED